MTASYEQAVAWLHEGDAHVAGLIDRLGDDGFAAPSGLPGWTRGHVVTHIARNADALVNLLTWARTGVETPMYSSREQRAAEIEAGATRPPAELREDVKSTTRRLAEAIETMPPKALRATVRTMTADMPASGVPWMRVKELWVHGVDLAAASTFHDLPAPLVDELIEDVAPVIAGKDGCPAVHLVATDRPVGVSLGDPEGAVEVTGTAADLCGWLLGRTAGNGLSTEGGDLPELPRWL